MAMTLVTAEATAIADVFDSHVNTGSGTAAIKFLTSGDSVLCTCDLNDPAFGDAQSGVIALHVSPTVTGTVDTPGEIGKVAIYDKDATQLATFSITETGGGGDFEIPDLSVAAQEVLTISSFSITVPSS